MKNTHDEERVEIINQGGASLIQFVVQNFLDAFFFQSSSIPVISLMHIANTLIKEIAKEQTEKFNLRKELKILYKKAQGEPLDLDEKNYDGKLHSLDLGQEILNGIKLVSGFSLVQNLYNSIFCSLSNKLYSHIPFILGYMGISYFGPDIALRCIDKVLNEVNLTEHQKKLCRPWLNAVACWALAFTPRVQTTLDNHMVYQYPSTSPKGSFEFFPKLDSIHSVSNHMIRMIVVKDGGKISVDFIRDNNNVIQINCEDESIKESMGFFCSEKRPLVEKQNKDNLFESNIPGISFFKNNCLRKIDPDITHSNQIESLLKLINKKMEWVEKNPDKTLCKYPVTNTSSILKFTDENGDNHYSFAIDRKSNDLGKGGTGSVTKVCSLIKMNNGWMVLEHPRVVKSLNFDETIGKVIEKRLHSYIEYLDCLSFKNDLRAENKTFQVLKKMCRGFRIPIDELSDRKSFITNIVKVPKNRTNFITTVVEAINKKYFLDQETMEAPKFINELSYGSNGFCISSKQDLRILDMALVPGRPIMSFDFQEESFSKKIDVSLKLFDEMSYLYDQLGIAHGDIEKGNNILYDKFFGVSIIDHQFLTPIKKAHEFVFNDLNQIKYVLNHIFSKELKMFSGGNVSEIMKEIKYFLDKFPYEGATAGDGYEFFKKVQHKMMEQEHFLVPVYRG